MNATCGSTTEYTGMRVTRQEIVGSPEGLEGPHRACASPDHSFERLSGWRHGVLVARKPHFPKANEPLVRNIETIVRCGERGTAVSTLHAALHN